MRSGLKCADRLSSEGLGGLKLRALFAAVAQWCSTSIALGQHLDLDIAL